MGKTSPGARASKLSEPMWTLFFELHAGPWQISGHIKRPDTRAIEAPSHKNSQRITLQNWGHPHAIPIPAYRHMMPQINPLPPDGEADLEDDSQTATFGVSTLKHGYSKVLQPVFMLVQNDFPPSFDIEIGISCNETEAFESVIKVECVLAGTS
ncbi:MAG: hypothetical protein WBO17_04780 [Sphingorhabdus sp.]